ncbi:MAG: type VI secretion system baseplate subunit TssF [Acidobacteria bacterium]|nr:type VI secretion system baseplate subunit TssF [Acidobacteriota bacterium]
MATLEHGEFLRYYWQELSYLRKMGQRFAQRYPKVAERLELQPNHCPDPHVERLIESFAFLTGRIQQSIDSDYPEIAAELLNLLYPHYLNPVPSMSVARFEVDPEQGKLTSGHRIPRHTPLFAQARDGQITRFRSCYPVDLWPVEVTAASFEPPGRYDFLDTAGGVATVLRLRLVSTQGSFREMELDRLRFYLNADRVMAYALYERLFGNLLDVLLLPDASSRPRSLTPEAVEAVGFGAEEEVLPYPHYAHPAYRLLQEYFVFPEKYHFFDVSGLGPLGADGSFELLFLLDRPFPSQVSLAPEIFALGCSPIINLFPKVTEPIRVDHRQLEYRLVADYRREKTTEIHSIQAVSGSADLGHATRRYEAFYSFSHPMERRRHQAFWHARRVPAVRDDVGGTDLLLSFVDLDFNPRLPPQEVVYAHTLCTNRDLAAQMPAEALLMTDVPAPLARIVCLKKPTFSVTPPLGGQTLWRLISQLSLNHLSLGEGVESLKALREILRLYCPEEDAASFQQILGLREMSQRKIVHRVGREAWRGFIKGTEVRLTFEENLYVGSSAFLLAAVLNHFFAQYASTNSFTQLVIESTRREGEWKRWQPMAGAKVLL